MTRRAVSRNWDWLETMFLVFSVLTVLNAFAFVAGAVYIGGDAASGKVEGGRYYVYGVRTENGRKVHTEVSPSVFAYSKCHVFITITTWFIMCAGSAVMSRRDRQGYKE